MVELAVDSCRKLQQEFILHAEVAAEGIIVEQMVIFITCTGTELSLLWNAQH